MKSLTVLYRTRNKVPEHLEQIVGRPVRKLAESYETLKSAVEEIQKQSTFSKRQLGNGTIYAEYIINTPVEVQKGIYERNLRCWGSYIVNEKNKNISLTVNSFKPDNFISAAKEFNLKVPEKLEQRLRGGK